MEGQSTVAERRTAPSLVDLCLYWIITEDNYVTLQTDAIKALPVELIQMLMNFTVKTVQSSLITTEIALKIRLLRHNRLVTFRFKLHGTVADTIQEIYDKAARNDGGPTDITKYGLYQRGSGFRPTRWLDVRKTLSNYDLKPGVRNVLLLLITCSYRGCMTLTDVIRTYWTLGPPRPC